MTIRYALIAATFIVCAAVVIDYWPAIKLLYEGRVSEARLVGGLIYSNVWQKLHHLEYRDPVTGHITFLKGDFDHDQKRLLEGLSVDEYYRNKGKGHD